MVGGGLRRRHVRESARRAVPVTARRGLTDLCVLTLGSPNAGIEELARRNVMNVAQDGEAVDLLPGRSDQHDLACWAVHSRSKLARPLLALRESNVRFKRKLQIARTA